MSHRTLGRRSRGSSRSWKSVSEPLEPRRLLATVTVTTINDTHNGNTTSIANLIAANGGDGISLREAIDATNNTPNSGGPDVINFQIPGTGIHTITYSDFMYIITEAVVIDATTESDYAGLPRVELNGVASNVNGLNLTQAASGSTIRGLSIGNFSSSGILLQGSNNVVEACHLGVDATGTVARGNADAGVSVSPPSGDATGNRIGGTTAAQRNVISSNGFGVRMNALPVAPVQFTLVQGNYIGTNAAGTADLGNTNYGVLLSGPSAANTIGGDAAGAGNVISGNNLVGVYLDGFGVSGNWVAGNLIGTNAAGTAAVPNGTGVLLDAAESNTIGYTTAAGRNVISGNSQHGVQMVAANGTFVQGNYIGTDVTGMIDLGNTLNGVQIDSADINTIGGTDAGARNVISGNGQHGIVLGDGGTVQNNYIGTNAAGTAALPNTVHGVYGFDRSDNLIRDNVISGNMQTGVLLDGGCSDNIVDGNFIGLNAAGTATVPNSIGVEIRAAANNLVGGTTAGSRNVISGNNIGVYVSSVSAVGNRIEGNYIGTNAAGTAAVGGNSGIHTVAISTRIGGTAPGAGNLISGNAVGVNLDFSASNSFVEGNLIGTNAAGTGAIGNSLAGVWLQAANCVVGGTSPAARNVISGNATGILVSAVNLAPRSSIYGNYIGTDITGAVALGNDTGIDTGAQVNIGTPGGGNVISGNTGAGIRLSPSVYGSYVFSNLIGVAANGTAAVGNGSHGIRISTSPSGFTYIGQGSSASHQNVIAHNGGSGIATIGTTAHIAIRRNAIHSNALLGIDMGGDGVTPNDAGDSDEVQNYPVITSAVVTAAGHTIINGTLGGGAKGVEIHFYRSGAPDSSGYGEGETYVHSFEGAIGGAGILTFSLDLPTALPVGAFVTATATTSGDIGRTSEFAQSVQVVEVPSFTITDVSVTEGNAGTTAATFTVNRSGNTTAASSVLYTTAIDSAVAPGDYAHVPATLLSFAAGETSKTITVLVSGDTTFEPDESFFVNLSNPVNATVGDAQAIGTITNDDADLSPPAVLASSFNFVGFLPTPYEVQFQMNEPVTASPGGVPVLIRRVDNGQLVATVMASIQGGSVVFGQMTTPLADGNYRATLPAGAVADLAGNPLAFDTDVSFFILGADANRDRRVDVNDLVILAANWLGTGKAFTDGDFNYDGIVNKPDLGTMAERWHVQLDAPPQPAAPAPTVAGRRAPVRTPTRVIDLVQ